MGWWSAVGQIPRTVPWTPQRLLQPTAEQAFLKEQNGQLIKGRLYDESDIPKRFVLMEQHHIPQDSRRGNFSSDSSAISVFQQTTPVGGS